MFSSIHIEPSTKCHVNCSICPVYKPPVSEIPSDEMSLETISKISKYSNNILKIHKFGIGNWSEPFLHRDLIRLTQILKTYGAETIFVNSNLSLSLDIDKIIKSNTINRINVSVSGLDEETYHKYHRKGNLKLVLDNIKKLKDSNINIVVKWHRFKYNEHQLEEAKEFFEKMNISFYSYYAHMGCVEHTISYFKNQEKLSKLKLDFINENIFVDKIKDMCKSSLSMDQEKCKQNDFITIHSDGHILHCCALYSAHLTKSKKPLFEMTKKEIEQFKNNYYNFCIECKEYGICGYFNNPKIEEFYNKGKK